MFLFLSGPVYVFYTHGLPTSVFVCRLSCLYSCTDSCEVHHCKGPDIWYPKKRTIQQLWQFSCCVALWQFSDCFCNVLAGVFATLTMKRVKGSFVRRSDPYITEDSILRCWRDRLWSMSNDYMLNGVLSGWCPKRWAGSGSNKTASGRLNKSSRRVNPEKNIMKLHS